MIYKKIRQNFYQNGNAIIEFPVNRKLIIIGITLFVNTLNPDKIPEISITKEVQYLGDPKTYKDNIVVGALTIVNNNTYYYLDNYVLRPYYGFVIPSKTYSLNNQGQIVFLPIHTNKYKRVVISTINTTTFGYLEVDYMYQKDKSELNIIPYNSNIDEDELCCSVSNLMNCS